jgi:beta-galactosidase GanA
MSDLFYGVAYYDEYMPEDRLAKDIALMRETGINVVRIAESTWSTLEPGRASITSTISTGCWTPCMKRGSR